MPVIALFCNALHVDQQVQSDLHLFCFLYACGNGWSLVLDSSWEVQSCMML